MILFLDFDGVLHPQPHDNGDEFCLRPLFEGLVRDFPDLRIVISSSWRHQEDLATLRGHFSEGVAAMIVDVTPDYKRLPAEFEPSLVEYPRHREISYWCAQHDVPEGGWIALDDDLEVFEPDCPQLVSCEPSLGLTEHLATRIRALLVSRLGPGRYLAP